MSLEAIKAKADALGISYHHRAGEAKIQGLIDEHLAAHPEIPESWSEGPAREFAPITKPVEREFKGKKGKILEVKIQNGNEYERMVRDDNAHKVAALVRCRVTCMNPAKKEWPGEVISVGSRKHGTFKKFIPFDGQEYHIPRIIYEHLKERKCTIFQNIRDKKNGVIRKGKLIDEFAIEVLPPLTKEEIDDLRIQQAAARGQRS